MISNNNNNLVLLCTSAVKIINPSSGRFALVYAQHDTVFQVTLISERLSNELGLKLKDSPAITICRLTEESTPASGVVQFNLESLTTKKLFAVKDAVVVPGFIDDERVLPHDINTANLEHFKGVEIPTIPEVNSVDILIGQPHKSLLTVLEERKGARSEEPNYVLTRLGPIASGGSLCVE